MSQSIVIFWFAMASNMLLPLTLFVLAGLVSADYEHGWKVGNEYTYLVRSRTLTSLDQLSNQYTGILMKALLTVQAKDANTLTAKVSRGQYARIHKDLPKGWETEISDQMLELRDLPISEKPFEIKLKHGVILDIIVDRDVPTWEVNLLKSIVSQLQVDTQGENIIKSKNMQIPDNDEPYGSFKVMEDTVGGKCEVIYDITPLPEHILHMKPELVPIRHGKVEGQHIDIMKTKNFDNCEQRMNYHFGITEQTNWEPGSNKNGKFLTKSSSSRTIITGDLKRFVIQSSVTTSKMFISPRFFDHQNGNVFSRMNLTLSNLQKISNRIPSPRNPESTGNLVYIYSNPFSDNEERRATKGMEHRNQAPTSDSVSSLSSSEEATKNKPNLRSSGSGSSSASSSSISSSEEHQFWQPKPTLEDAPQNPLLPNFIGYKGKFIGKSGEINVIKASKELVLQIANELEDPSNIPTQESLEKFTILTSLIRTMNRNQIAEVEGIMHISPNDLKSNDKSQAVKQNAWAVFRDAITQAGTGPALLTIKNWIERRDIGSTEAADILSRIPRTARTPTAEYIKAFFDLTTNSKVMNQVFLNTTALMAFTELLHQSQVNGRSIHNQYPVHTFGRLTSKHDETLVQEYIPYLARELKKAVKDGDSPRIQTYIVALGNIGHPKILSVFEPYLEGKEQMTTFQRTLIVSSLSKLASTVPKLARSVLYKIYLNTMEVHEVRCVAVYLLASTNPPLSMLQRMAEFTNYDNNKHVNSAVKSTIQTLASLTDPEWQDLAKKARSVTNLLSSNDYSYQYSHGFIIESASVEKNIASSMIFNYIGSDDSLIPSAFYLGWLTSYGDFKTPPTELIAMISSVRPLLDIVQKTSKDKQPFQKMAVEKIAEELNIMAKVPVELEGNIIWKTKFLSRFMPFDKNTVHDIKDSIIEHLMEIKNGGFINLNKLMSYDVTLSFPTETGLPFVYTLRVPILHKISGDTQFKMSKDLSVSAKTAVRLVYSRKIQGRIGFVTPFEHHHFIAGVDVNTHVFAPIKASLDVNVPTKNVKLNVWPLKGEEKSRLLHYSVVPYTSSHDILSLRPVLIEKGTQKVHIDEPVIVTWPNKVNKGIRLDIEADKSNDEFWSMDLDKLQNMFPWNQEDDTYRKLDVFMDLEREQSEPVTLIASYDSVDMGPDSKDSQLWTPTAKAVEPSSKEADSQDRRQQFLNEAAKGIKLAKSQVVDIQLQVPGKLKTRNTMTVAWSTSNVESKQRTLLYWSLDVPNEEIKQEVCAASQSLFSPDNSLFIDEVMSSKPKGEFDIAVRYGKSCSDNEQINIRGKAIQSSDMTEEIKKSVLMKECEKQMKHGNKLLRVCQNAAALAMTLDEMDISMDIRSKQLQSLVSKAISLIESTDYVDAVTDTSNPNNAGKDKIDFKVKLSKDLKSADVAVHTPTMDMKLNELDVTPLDLDSSEDTSIIGNLNIRDTEEVDEPLCVLDSTRAETFDGKGYPLRLDSCWKVLMTTVPQVNPDKPTENLQIPEENSVSILSRDIESGKKEIKVVLGQNEIMLLPTSQPPEVKVNGQKVPISQENSHQEKQDSEVLFEIFKRGEHSIALVSEKFELQLVFDGKRVAIQGADWSRDSVRGLCGNFDGDASNDFTSPNNCILRKPDQFIASYTLTKDQCEGEDLKNVKSLQNIDCVPQVSARQSNVINDIESGKSTIESKNWGYHQDKQVGDKRCVILKTRVEEKDGKICFSTRPIVSCASECHATEIKSKSYQFHCMDRNAASLNMKKRIEKGAIPDLSQKSVSMSKSIDVPLACQA